MFKKIAGRAGHGKTHALIQAIKNLYDPEQSLERQSFILITPTNKAAMVLNSRLAEVDLPPLARTLHSTLYSWRETDRIKGVKRTRLTDPDTGRFARDEKGNAIWHEENEYYMEKIVKRTIANKVVFVDESSMVNSEVWYDLINCGFVHEINAYGDEQQLPPIEEYEKLPDEYKPYFKFWHNFNDPVAVERLRVNYRQQGSLKDIVETIEQSLFNSRFSNDIPSNLMFGDNYTVHSADMTEADLLKEVLAADIIITPHHKVRRLVNQICRRAIAKMNNRNWQRLPVPGDKIIFVDSMKEETEVNGRTIKEIIVAKNLNATVLAVHDVDVEEHLLVLDLIDETGVTHEKRIVSIDHVLGFTTHKNKDYPRIDYAYAVTVHSSQGGQWPNVLFLNGPWWTDAEKLRYVGITRAQKRLAVINGITNTNEPKDAAASLVIRLALELGWK